MTHHILVIASSHAQLAGEPNGTYLPELTHAIHEIEAAGITWDLASPDGGEIPFYGADGDDLTSKMLANDAFRARLSSTTPLTDVDAERYDAVFFPGGYGLLFDLVDNQASQRIAASVYERGQPVAAVCHGPAALAKVELSSGAALVEGKTVTGFTREEEVEMDTLDKVPFLLEVSLLDGGATYQKQAAMAVHVVEDGHLITGQNPPSAAAVGEALVRQLASSTKGDSA